MSKLTIQILTREAVVVLRRPSEISTPLVPMELQWNGAQLGAKAWVQPEMLDGTLADASIQLIQPMMDRLRRTIPATMRIAAVGPEFPLKRQDLPGGTTWARQSLHNIGVRGTIGEAPCARDDVWRRWEEKWYLIEADAFTACYLGLLLRFDVLLEELPNDQAS